MKERQLDEMSEIYYKTGELLVLLTDLNSKWVRVRDLINKHNYLDLNIFNSHSKTLDNLFSAEQQIRDKRNYYGKKIDSIKKEME